MLHILFRYFQTETFCKADELLAESLLYLLSDDFLKVSTLFFSAIFVLFIFNFMYERKSISLADDSVVF